MTSSHDVTSTGKVGWNVLPLDPSFYFLLDNEREFYKTHIGIQNDDELRQHILSVQSQAYSVVPYPCIRLFSFLRLNVSACPGYDKVLTLGKTRPGAIFLDVGTGLGTDLRKLVADGYPVKNIVATDLHPGLWEAGHSLFKSTTESLPVAFLPGDLFQLTKGIQEAPVLARPDLASLDSLLPLKGQVSVLYAAYFLHLFDEERCKDAAGRLALLLSHEPGSIIFGLNLGSPEGVVYSTSSGSMMCHSPTTWAKMWHSCFPPDTIRVEARLQDGLKKLTNAYSSNQSIKLLKWSVERL